MRGARIPLGSAIIDSSIHYFAATNESEAAFLVSLLNAPSLRRAFAESRTSGRHFANNPWRVIPIPRYDTTIQEHRTLAALCQQAETTARKLVDSKNGQIKNSEYIRSTLSECGIFSQIDKVVQKLLPDYYCPDCLVVKHC